MNSSIDEDSATAISLVETTVIQLPLRRDWRWRGMEGNLGRWVIVEVHTNDGLVGLGEAAALPDWGGDHQRYYGETSTTVTHIVRDVLAPVVRGMQPFDATRIYDRMNQAVRGHPYAKAAIEMAALDLHGKIVGQPIYQLLGGLARDRVPIAHMIGLMSPDQAFDEASAVAAEGMRAFQIKGTGSLAEDLAVVLAVRSAVGDDAVLRFDANQGYRGRSVKVALHQLRQIVDAGVSIVEQPTEGLRGMFALREGLDASVMADETVWGLRDVIDVAENRAADAVSIYVAKAGGIRRGQVIAALCEEFGMPCDLNGSLESGVGNAASVQLALSAPNVTLPSVIPLTTLADRTGLTGRYFQDDIVTTSMTAVEGAIVAPAGPGLGVTLDPDKIARYRVAE